jgi:tetratricopeptide (TPR) repeat protein
MTEPDSIRVTRTSSRVRRYPGVRPFQDRAEDYALFFGRRVEIEQLYLRVLSVSLLVQFARSGLGKTSLLQAGLFPLLRQKPLLPVLVRLNQEEPLVYTVSKAIERACVSEGLEFTAGKSQGLWELLADTIVWREDLLLTPVLVFDQFEEVFTLRSESFREEFAQELAALACGNPPERLRFAKMDVPQQSDGRAKTRPPRVKLIISLREEYLGSLEEFSIAIPQLFEERLRLGPLNEAGARDAIKLPAGRVDAAIYSSPPFEFESQAVEGIIAFLKGKSGIIEPFQLQLVCQHAEDLVMAKTKSQASSGLIQLTLADFGGMKGLSLILEHFYKKTISNLAKNQQSKARRLCEEGLLDINGHRLMLRKEQIQADYKVTDETLDSMSDERLLVREPRLNSLFYEISHDRLAASIQRAQPFRLPRRLRRRLFTGAAVTVAMLAVVLWGWEQTKQERNHIEQERSRVEKLLSFMLGEKLQAEMRGVGRGDLLQLIQEKSEQSLQEENLNKGLALRNSGNLHRYRGNIERAIRDFRQAQAIFEGSAAISDDKIKAELARTLMELGSALSDRGMLSDALRAYEQALEIRRGIHNRYLRGAQPELLKTYAWNSMPALELAEALDYLGVLYYRAGAVPDALKYHEEAISIAKDHLFDIAESSGQSGKPDSEELEPFLNLAEMVNPTALKVLTSAVGSRATELSLTAEGKNEGFGPYLFLVKEFVSSRPLSAEPRLVEGQAVFWRAMGKYLGKTVNKETKAEFKKVVEAFEMLVRVDPQNALWRRELSMAQAVISTLTFHSCMQKASLCHDKDLTLMQAERQNLEGVEQLRDLVGKDKANLSWKLDLAQALALRAEILGEKKQVLAQTDALHEAIRIYSESMDHVDDAETKSSFAGLYRQRAEAWKNQGKIEKALGDQQQARLIYENLVAELPNHPTYPLFLIVSLAEEIELHKKDGDQSVVARLEKQKTEQENARRQLPNAKGSDIYKNSEWEDLKGVANKAEKQKEPKAAIEAYRIGVAALRKDAEADPHRAAIWSALAQAQQDFALLALNSKNLTEAIEIYRQALLAIRKAVEISPAEAQYQNEAALAHISLGDALQTNEELEGARDQFKAALPFLRAASRLDPTEAAYHGSAREVYNRIHQVNSVLFERNPASQYPLLKERERAFRGALHEAWKATAFSNEEHIRKAQHEQFLMAKRNLAKFLVFENRIPHQAFLLMGQVVVDREATIASDPTNPEDYCRVGEADYAVGFLRRKQALLGWEESIRKGLLAIDWGIKIAGPGKPDILSLCLKFSGLYRMKLGEFLLEDERRQEAIKELEIALPASQNALQLTPEDEEIKGHIQKMSILKEALNKSAITISN